MADYIRILATDTSTRHCSVALCRVNPVDGMCDVMAQTLADRHKLHAERLLDSMRCTLDAAGASLRDVDCLAVSIGPGSFTGLRVGAAAWKGLAFALRLPLAPVPTLNAMTRLNAFTDGLVIPMLDARMGEVFGAVYRFVDGRREKLTPDKVCRAEDFFSDAFAHTGPLLVLGDGAWRYRERILQCAPHAHFADGPRGMPCAAAVASEAALLLWQGVDTDPAKAAPRYLRASQAEQARAERNAHTPQSRNCGQVSPG